MLGTKAKGPILAQQGSLQGLGRGTKAMEEERGSRSTFDRGARFQGLSPNKKGGENRYVLTSRGGWGVA